jgi:hypothetical protein
VSDKLAEKPDWSSFRDGDLTPGKSTFRAMELCDIQGA